MRATISDTLSCSRVINGGDVRMFLQQINGNCLLDTCPTASLKTGTCAVTKSCQDGEKDTEVECKVLLPYFATPTDIPGQEDRRWTAIFEAEDTYGLRTREQKNFSISSLKAVTVSGPTEFGSLSLGSVAVSAPISIINSGNTTVSLVRIKVSPMKCKIGAIPPTSFFFSFTPNLPLEQMSPVPSDGIVRSVVNLSKPNALIQSAQKIYWNLKVPKQGLSGTCSGKINYIAE